MTHPPAPAHRRPARRGVPRTGQMITSLSGLAALLAVAIGLAPAASAMNVPPPGISGATVAPPPPPSPATAVPAHLPLWAILTMIAATVLLSVATTLITLSLAHRRRAPVPAPERPAASAAVIPEQETAQDDALTGRLQAARQGTHQAGTY
jgi:hypothetical protein